jgi:hypothetical protein
MRTVHIALAIASGLALSGCATMTVSSHVAPDVDRGTFIAYDWGPADDLPTSDARLATDPYFHDFVQGAVEKQLASKGYERATPGRPPDLLIHYHANIAVRLELNRASGNAEYCVGDDCARHVSDYEAATLVIDIVDARTNRVVWRGWAQDRIDGVLENRDRLREKVDVAVQRIIARFERPSELGGR